MTICYLGIDYGDENIEMDEKDEDGLWSHSWPEVDLQGMYCVQ